RRGPSRSNRTWKIGTQPIVENRVASREPLAHNARPRRRRGARVSKARDLAHGLAYLSPNLIGFLVFTFLPVLAIFVVAFTTGDYTSGFDAEGRFRIDAEWCGLDHFRTMLGDGELWQSLWNTAFLMLSIPIQMACALGLAILLNQKVPGRVLYRT